MARKKRQTYNEMLQMMRDMQKKIDTAKDHMAEVLASELDYETAMILGDLLDNELRRVMVLMFQHIKLFRNLAMLNPQLQSTENESMVEGELKYNYSENRWEVWDTDTGKQVGTLRDGMCVELFDGEDWIPARVGVVVMDNWSLKMDKGTPGTCDGVLFLFSDLRVRCPNA